MLLSMNSLEAANAGAQQNNTESFAVALCHLAELHAEQVGREHAPPCLFQKSTGRGTGLGGCGWRRGRSGPGVGFAKLVGRGPPSGIGEGSERRAVPVRR